MHRCFWIEETGEVRLALRRWSHGADRCAPPGAPLHTAEVVIGLAPMSEHLHAPGERYLQARFEVRKDDPRWPQACQRCSYRFQPEDEWQHDVHPLYAGTPEGGTRWVGALREAPPGAMWDAWWVAKWKPGPGGIRLNVQTPAGIEWDVDGPANNGPGWSREGMVPNVTARPSIQIDPAPDYGREGYHGFLTRGWLHLTTEEAPC